MATRLGLSITAVITSSAASSGDSVGKASYSLVGAIIGVRTSGMLMVVKRTLASANSGAAHHEKASSAAFDAT